MIIMFVFAICTAATSNAQLSKVEVDTFLSAHSPKDVQRVSVISYTGYKKTKLMRNGDVFEAETTVITALENSIHIKDGTGKEMYIPYVKIKALSFQPENKNKYSMIRVDI